jgi:hypothetical protein
VAGIEMAASNAATDAIRVKRKRESDGMTPPASTPQKLTRSPRMNPAKAILA